MLTPCCLLQIIQDGLLAFRREAHPVCQLLQLGENPAGVLGRSTCHLGRFSHGLVQVPRLLGQLTGAFLGIAQPLRPEPRDLTRETLSLRRLPPLLVLPAVLLTTLAEDLCCAPAVLFLTAKHLRLLPSLLGHLPLALGLRRLYPRSFPRPV